LFRIQGWSLCVGRVCNHKYTRSNESGCSLIHASDVFPVLVTDSGYGFAAARRDQGGAGGKANSDSSGYHTDVLLRLARPQKAIKKPGNSSGGQKLDSKNL
jgi:hypothetical protein